MVRPSLTQLNTIETRSRPVNRVLSPSRIQSGFPEPDDTTSKWSSLGPTGPQSADPNKEPSARRGRTGGRNVWLACELHKLPLEVSRHKDLNGRIRWSNLASAWESQRDPEDPQRTVAALKAAYAKLRKKPMTDVTNDAEVNGEVREDSVQARENLSLGSSREVSKALGQAKGNLSREASVDREVVRDLPNPVSTTVTAPLCEPSLKDQVLQRVEKYLNVACSSRDRVSIRRPGHEIPQVLLEIGNDILLDRMPEPVSQGQRYISKLNDLVYAVGRAIAATSDSLGPALNGSESLKSTLSEEIERRRVLVSSISVISNELDRRKVRKRGERKRVSRKYLELSETLGDKAGSRLELVRYLRQLKDQLNTTQQKIKRVEESKRLMQVRRKGASYVAHRQAPSEKDTVVVPVTSVREYWKPIVGTGRPFRAGFQLKKWAEDLGAGSTPETGQELSEVAWQELYRKVKPWKATGPDGIQGFWWKHLPAARSGLTRWCCQALVKPRKMIPSWLCQGRVILIPKEVKQTMTRGPGDYRPIACLNTCYKILTASLSAHIRLTVGDRFPREQIALRKGVWGCTHAHILDQSVIKDAMRHKKEIHMLWIDLAKAFDSLSHGAIRWACKQWGVASNVRRLLSVIMSCQSVRYCGFENGKISRSRPLTIRNGLMQGDALSPLLFCLTIAPISHWIRNNVKPYRTVTGTGRSGDGDLTVGHILYMDDLKIYTPDREDMATARTGIQGLFGQLGLELNARKCASSSLNCATPAQLDSIPVLGRSEFYKYLGAEQNGLVCINELYDRVESAAKAVARRLLFSDLTVRQKVNGFNQIVIPKLKYAFSCVIFGAGKLGTLRKRANRFDADIRKVMEESGLRFRGNCAARLYVEKEAGGLGLKSVEEELEKSIAYTWCYLASNTDLLVPYQLSESLRSSHKRSLTSDFQKVLCTNGIEGRIQRTTIATIKVDGQTFFNATDAARAVAKLIRNRWAKVHMSAWKGKAVAGRVIHERRLGDEPNGLCLKDSFLWSAKGWVSSKVLRNVWAVQEGSLLTRCSAAGRASMPESTRVCRMHCAPNAMETAEHIVSACSHWRTNIMVERHDDVARVLYASIRRKYNIQQVVNTHVPHVLDMGTVVIHWNDSIWTSEGLAHNKPDILVWDRLINRLWIIEISVSWFTRVLQQEKRKLGKYGINSTLPEDTPVDGFLPGPSLKSVLQKDRKCRVDVIPIVLGTCGEVSPNLRHYIQALELPEDTGVLIEKLERSAVQGTNRLVKCHLANS